MTPDEADEARRLLKAARADLRAANALAVDTEQADEVIGFHSQQAVEKAIKSVLVASGVEIPDTHDLAFLLDVVTERTITTPHSIAQADWLTPWAVAARYGTSVAPLDRKAAVAVAADAVEWAVTVVDSGPGAT